MNWTSLLILAAVVAVIFVLKQLSFVSVEVARQHLRDGAVVVDVRSRSEFQSGHLPNALNIPLGELGATLPNEIPDKQQTLLLHCLSGGRSGIAKTQLKRMGYSKVFNLGSYQRAQRVVEAR